MRKTAPDRKADIVAATLALADRPGPERLSVEAVAASVGLSQPGVFRHFPRKRDLWDAVGVEIAARMTAAWDAAADPADPPLAALRRLALAQLALVAATPAIPAILFSRELHADNDALRARMAGLMAAFLGRLAALAAAARDAGALRADLAPADAALLAAGLVQSAVLRWSLTGRTASLTEDGARLLDVQLALMAARP